MYSKVIQAGLVGFVAAVALVAGGLPITLPPLFSTAAALPQAQPAVPATGESDAAANAEGQGLITKIASDLARVAEQKSPPVRISIPSVGLDAPVHGVGINARGEMDVPGGDTNNVGWYKYGAIPGTIGTAVFDAHVFAAFSELNTVKVGDDIYVATENGSRLHFVVQDAVVYKLGDLTPPMLFGSDGSRKLNLITCAGELTADGSTYTHRLVVSATLAP